MKTSVNIFNALNESFEKEITPIIEKNQAEKALRESQRYQVRKYTDDYGEFNGTFGLFDTEKDKFIRKGSKKVMDAAAEELNTPKVEEAEVIEEGIYGYDYIARVKDNTGKEGFLSGDEDSLTFWMEEDPDMGNLFRETEVEQAKNRAERANLEFIELIPLDSVLKNTEEVITEEQTVYVNGGNPDQDIDYIISDVTVLEPVADGDVQAPDIDALLTLIGESLKAEYGDEFNHINILSSRITESDCFALVDISTKEIVKEFEEKGITDAAVGKNLIIEAAGNLYEFKVNSLNGVTKFSKKTANIQETIKEWIETEFLSEAKKEKVEMEEIPAVKDQKEVVEFYLAIHPELQEEIARIKSFIDLAKEAKIDNVKEAIQDRMYGFAVEFPINTEVTNKEDKYELKFNTIDEIVEIIFGKEFVKEKEEIPEVISQIKESYMIGYYCGNSEGYMKAEGRHYSGTDNKLEALKFSSREEAEEAKRKIADDVGPTLSLRIIEESSEVASKSLKESYEQFNIGDIEVVFNPETYETLYSIPSAEVVDKKINLTKIPSVETPYDTNTIIKSYIETRFGRIPSEEEAKAAEEIENVPVEEVPVEVPAEETIPTEEPVEVGVDMEEAELPEEPTEGEIPAETIEEVPQAETGDATFLKIRPKQPMALEEVREGMLEADTPRSSYIVVDETILSDEEWNDLTSDLTKPQAYLEGIKPIDRKNYSFNVVKLSNTNADYSLLVDPLGYNYPRYIGIAE